MAPPCTIVPEGFGRIQGWGFVKHVGQNGEKWLRNVEKWLRMLRKWLRNVEKMVEKC